MVLLNNRAVPTTCSTSILEVWRPRIDYIRARDFVKDRQDLSTPFRSRLTTFDRLLSFSLTVFNRISSATRSADILTTGVLTGLRLVWLSEKMATPQPFSTRQNLRSQLSEIDTLESEKALQKRIDLIDELEKDFANVEDFRW